MKSIKLYRELVYRAGGVVSGDTGEICIKELRMEMDRDFELPKADLFKYHVHYFSDCMVIGSKSFIKEAYDRYGDY